MSSLESKLKVGFYELFKIVSNDIFYDLLGCLLAVVKQDVGNTKTLKIMTNIKQIFSGFRVWIFSKNIVLEKRLEGGLQ